MISELHVPFDQADFSLMLWADRPASVEEMTAVCPKRVGRGCRSAVCGGIACEDWHDAFDDASLEGPLVMTTWHEGEPIEDVVEYFLTLTSFEDYESKNFLLLLLGPNDELIAVAQRASRAIG